MDNPNQIKFRGGAQIGKIKTSWPFVTLTVTKELITLKVLLTGEFTFTPKDVTVIETLKGRLERGLRIKHNKNEYKENIEFLSMQNPEEIINQIRMIGFPTSFSI